MVWNKERYLQTQRNWFSRLARSLSSPFSGFGIARSRSSTLPQEEPKQQSSLHETFAASSIRSEPFAVNDSNPVYVKDGSRISFPMSKVPQRPLVEQSRLRLAGHTTRIRLEPPSPMIKQMISETPREILDVSRLSALPAAVAKAETASPTISETPREILDVSRLSALPAAPAKTETDIHVPVARPEVAKRDEAMPSHLPIRNGITKIAPGNQRHLPTGRMFKGNIRIAAHNPVCGSGEFSCGQRDVVIKNPAVRASSVIIVTLTSNPGPVAVHYVSLLPYESFTVHLTAPTTMHTRFNYLIVSGELT